MSFTPEKHGDEGLRRVGGAVATARRAVKAYSERPIYHGFNILLAIIILLLVFNLRVRAELWLILIGLGLIRFHEWYKTEGYLSPFLGSLAAKFPQRPTVKKKDES